MPPMSKPPMSKPPMSKPPVSKPPVSKAFPSRPGGRGRDRSGSVAIEFAVIAPIVIGIIVAILEFGLTFFTLNTAQQAVWRAARQVATGQVTAAEAAGLVRAQLPVWAQTNATIPPASLNNGIYTVSVSLKLADATPLRFATVAYGANVVALNASFQSEVN